MISVLQVGDAIIGLPSNGLHSNGFSLIHTIMEQNNFTLNSRAPFSEYGLTFGKFEIYIIENRIMET